MYCGSNRRHPDVMSGRRTIGSRYDCFRRGFGVGINQPADPNYRLAYVPVDPRKVYCGKQNRLPANYDLMGSPNLCFRKGVGVGKAQKARSSPKKGPKRPARKPSRKSPRKKPSKKRSK